MGEAIGKSLALKMNILSLFLSRSVHEKPI
jgi:hypothetical protein